MKKSWEKALLAATLVFLGLGGLAMGLLAPTPDEIIEVPKDSAKPVKPLDVNALNEMKKAWSETPAWTDPADKHDLFIARKHLYFPETETVRLDDNASELDGISLRWLEKYAIPLSETVRVEDPDKDGFTNFMEYNKGTNSTDPTDAKSHPPYIERLRLKEFDAKPFRLQFKSYNEVEGKLQFQLNLKDAAKPSRFVGINDTLEKYKVTDFRKIIKPVENKTTGIVTPTDVSELDLLREDIGEKITLTLGKEINSPDSTANFVLVLADLADKVIKVQRGAEFEIPQNPGTKYRLLDVTSTGAKIKGMAKGEEIVVPKLDPVELNDLPTSAPAPVEGEMPRR